MMHPWESRSSRWLIFWRTSILDTLDIPEMHCLSTSYFSVFGLYLKHHASEKWYFPVHVHVFISWYLVRPCLRISVCLVRGGPGGFFNQSSRNRVWSSNRCCSPFNPHRPLPLWTRAHHWQVLPRFSQRRLWVDYPRCLNQENFRWSALRSLQESLCSVGQFPFGDWKGHHVRPFRSAEVRRGDREGPCWGRVQL